MPVLYRRQEQRNSSASWTSRARSSRSEICVIRAGVAPPRRAKPAIDSTFLLEQALEPVCQGDEARDPRDAAPCPAGGGTGADGGVVAPAAGVSLGRARVRVTGAPKGTAATRTRSAR